MGLQTRRRLGGLLWVAGLAVAVTWGALTYETKTPVHGIGYAPGSLVAAVDNGRLASVDVGLHELVEEGAVVARMDDSELALEREVLSAEFLAIADAGDGDPEEMMDAARKRSQTLRARAELATVESRLSRMKKLAADGAASKAEVDELENRRRELQQRVLEKQTDVVQDRRVNPWQVVAALKRIESLDANVEALSLRAGVSGQIVELLHNPGDVVRRGDPIVRVTPPATQEVMAWVSVSELPEPGASTEVVRVDGSILAASVVSVGAGLTAVPRASLPDPQRPQYGVAVRMKLTEGSVRPDEPVVVRL